MSGVNKVILIGNLGKDPECRAMPPNNDLVANLSVATSEQWKDKDTGEKIEKTEWHRVVLFKRLAEIAQQYLKKGSKIYIEGQIRTRKYQDADGQDKYITEIVAKNVQMLDGASDKQMESGKPSAKSGANGGGSATIDDDIPF